MLALLGLAGAAPAEGLHVFARKVETDEFPRVRVLFDVRSPQKLPFRELTSKNVRITEEEVPIRDLEVRPYRSGVSIGLVVDDSGSQDPTLGYLKEAACYLADRLAPYDEMTVIGFGRVIRPLEQLTTDKRLMKDAISALKAYGGSALYDGISAAMDEAANGIGRPVIVVVSDGREQDYPYRTRRLSEVSVAKLIRRARRDGVNIYSVGIGSKVDAEVLGLLAQETGGSYFAAPRAADLRALFAELASSFETCFQAIYQSPNLKEDRLLRGGLVEVRFKAQSGSGPFRYSMRPKTPMSTLAVARTESFRETHARLRIYTRGVRETWAEMEFALLDAKGRTVRQGRTTRDGYGAPLGGGIPEFLELEPGTYTLELRQPGTDLVFRHPKLVLERGKSTDLNFQFSKLVFRRNGQLWYDTEHALGDTSDLVDLTIEDLASGKSLRSGPMSIFKSRRDLCLWLEVGAYRVTLDNLFGKSSKSGEPKAAGEGGPPPKTPPGVQASVLRNALSCEVAAKGGDVLFFDVAYDDLLADEDPRLVPDDLPEPPRAGAEPRANRRLATAGLRGTQLHADQLREAVYGPIEEHPAPETVSPAERRGLRAKARMLMGKGTVGGGERDSTGLSRPAVSPPRKPKPAVPPVPPVSEAPEDPSSLDGPSASPSGARLSLLVARLRSSGQPEQREGSRTGVSAGPGPRAGQPEVAGDEPRRERPSWARPELTEEPSARGHEEWNRRQARTPKPRGATPTRDTGLASETAASQDREPSLSPSASRAATARRLEALRRRAPVPPEVTDRALGEGAMGPSIPRQPRDERDGVPESHVQAPLPVDVPRAASIPALPKQDLASGAAVQAVQPAAFAEAYAAPAKEPAEAASEPAPAHPTEAARAQREDSGAGVPAGPGPRPSTRGPTGRYSGWTEPGPAQQAGAAAAATTTAPSSVAEPAQKAQPPRTVQTAKLDLIELEPPPPPLSSPVRRDESDGSVYVSPLRAQKEAEVARTVSIHEPRAPARQVPEPALLQAVAGAVRPAATIDTAVGAPPTSLEESAGPRRENRSAPGRAPASGSIERLGQLAGHGGEAPVDAGKTGQAPATSPEAERLLNGLKALRKAEKPEKRAKASRVSKAPEAPRDPLSRLQALTEPGL